MSHESVEALPAGELLRRLRLLREEVSATASALLSKWNPYITRSDFVPSAANLASYLALRQTDLRETQTHLMPWGLSSIGRCESHVLPALDSVIATLQAISARQSRQHAPSLSEFFRGDDLLEDAAARLLGSATDGRRVRIMVTFPTEAANDYELVRELLECGMNVARINCAHDSREAWQAMIDNVHAAEVETGRTCKISMDLGGPKIRTQGIGFKRKHVFHKGDVVLLVTDSPGRSRRFPYQVRCSLREVFDRARPGEAVWIDDGIIGAVIEDVNPEGLVLRLEHVRPDGERIRPEKGINFPDTTLDIPALTEKDLEDLDFVSQNADLIGFSFVQTAEDVEQLQAELARRVHDKERLASIGIVAKIETKRAIANLPEIIVSAAGRQPLGVMIARGDLAVEIGFERLAEIQEELLWICEAAHVPVIWATQVMENFVKEGVPTRSEVTDAAMAERAECVMLNKGDYVCDAVTVLSNVLIRMEGHQFKKRAELRALKSWPIELVRPAQELTEASAAD
ncbi:MAG TPA: pyruvate kinase [Dehalococcoidia bacterium]|nr:pyruvate kinase [Dehalococcoidia bacterium]